MHRTPELAPPSPGPRSKLDGLARGDALPDGRTDLVARLHGGLVVLEIALSREALWVDSARETEP